MKNQDPLKKTFSRYITLASLPLLIILTTGTKRLSGKYDTHMKSFNKDSAEIAHALTDVYFKGIYLGDINMLGTMYYSGTLLFGDAGGQPYFKTIAQYLEGVRKRQSPKDSGKPFKGEIISIEIIQSIAVAKVHVKMYDFNYFELLSFHKLDGKWVIVNKMIADVEP
jgi:hypothetical protein